jgi:hypothetical protein
MPWKFKDPLSDQIEQFQKPAKDLQKLQEQFKQIHDAFMRAHGYVWVEDEPPETEKPVTQQPAETPKQNTRQELAVQWTGTVKQLCKIARVDPSSFHKWRDCKKNSKGHLFYKDGCSFDLNIRRVLNGFRDKS